MFEELEKAIERSQARRSFVQEAITERQVQSALSRSSFNPGRSRGSNKGGGKGPVGLGKNVAKHGKLSLEEVMKRIAQAESGGNYGALGQWNNLSYGRDRAYGKYQIMGNNIPSWTKDVLGKSLTPEQFLHRKKAQDRVALAKMKYYYKRYGAGGTAAAWYGGESAAKQWKSYRSKNYSADGTEYPSIFEYVKKILKG